MTESYKLELNFKTEHGKSKRLSIDHPKLGLTQAEIIPAMQAIIDADIFGDIYDPFAAADNARYVATTVNEIYDADAEDN